MSFWASGSGIVACEDHGYTTGDIFLSCERDANRLMSRGDVLNVVGPWPGWVANAASLRALVPIVYHPTMWGPERGRCKTCHPEEPT